MNAARNSERSYASAPAAQGLAAEVTDLFCNLGRALFDPYRPERHYMRGPGLRLGNGSRRDLPRPPWTLMQRDMVWLPVTTPVGNLTLMVYCIGSDLVPVLSCSMPCRCR